MTKELMLQLLYEPYFEVLIRGRKKAGLSRSLDTDMKCTPGR